MPRSKPPRRGAVRALASVLALLLAAPQPALAHNQQVHQDMVMVAYEIMRLAVRQPSLFAAPQTLPPGVTRADWEQFRADVAQATQRLPELEWDVDYRGRACQRWPRLRDIDRVPKTNFLTGVGCPKRSAAWVPQGIYTANNLGGVKDLTGPSLGFLAANVDNSFDDSHLSIRPGNNPIIGTFVDIVNGFIDGWIVAVLLPFVCGWRVLHGDFSCFADVKDLADAANPIDEIVDWIGIGDSTGEDWVGIWHHIDVRTSGVSNEFDDHQGFFLEETGYRGDPDIVERALQVAFDLEGLTLDPDTSQGRRFEQPGADDFHQRTRARTRSQWQAASIVHTPTLPLDNLALWGWALYRATHGTKSAGLAWPLHALGDAVAPMHTIGSPAWGHRPFEIAVEELWSDVRFVGDPAAEELQAQRVFAEAVRFRKLILDWRKAHPDRPDDLPIRDLVTVVAQETLAYSDQKMAATGNSWPFKRYASVVFHATSAVDFVPGVPGEEEAIRSYVENGGADNVRPLIEKGEAALLAFLTSAAEVR